MPITQFEGKALVFNNGVVDVQQDGVSVVDENKIAHITPGEMAIDELTIIKNSDNELEVPFDNDTIYRDENSGFIKAKGGASEGDVEEVRRSVQIVNDAVDELRQETNSEFEEIRSEIAGISGLSEGKVNEMIDIKINELDFASEGDIAQAISELDIPHYSAGENITISSEGVISSTTSGGISESKVNELIDLKLEDYISEGEFNNEFNNVFVEFAGLAATPGDKENWLLANNSWTNDFLHLSGPINFTWPSNLSNFENDTHFTSEGDLNEAIGALNILSEGAVNNLIDVKINELDYASEGDISAAIAELDIPEYSAGDHISISSAGVISATGIPTFTYDPTTQSLEITL